MNPDEARALLMVVALLMGASGSAGFVGGRMTAPVPPAEVRYVTLPAPAPPVEVAPAEPTATVPPIEPAAPTEPPPAAAPVEVKPMPQPRPKVEAKPKEQPKPKARPPTQKKSLPSCAFIKSEQKRMSWAEQMAAYHNSTAEEIAHGRRCLGL